MAIKAFGFDPRLGEQFIHAAYDIYRGDGRWIPPFEEEMRTQLSPDCSFDRNNGNGRRNFLALSRGRVVGRVSASVNSSLKDRDGTAVGAVGFFECDEDFGAASDLLDAAVAWIAEAHGLRRIWGPMNFDIWHPYRFMTRGFELEPFYGEPYNKPFYPEFFLRYGFSVKEAWDSIEISGRENLAALLPRGEERYRQLVERGYRFEPFNARRLDGELRRLHGVLTDSFSGFLGYTPITPAEFTALCSSCRHALDSRLSAFSYDEQGTLAGFAVALLDLADAVRAMRGQLGLAARLRFLVRRRRARRINFYIGGVTREEQAKGSGLGRAGYAHVVRRILDAGYDEMIQSLIVRNGFSHALAGPFRKNIRREYALYELNR
jgi:hypothetical protein